MRPMGLLSMSTASHSAPRNHRATHRVLTLGKRGREGRRGWGEDSKTVRFNYNQECSPRSGSPQEAVSHQGAGASIGDIHMSQRSHLTAHGAKRKRQKGGGRGCLCRRFCFLSFRSLPERADATGWRWGMWGCKASSGGSWESATDLRSIAAGKPAMSSPNSAGRHVIV